MYSIFDKDKIKELKAELPNLSKSVRDTSEMFLDVIVHGNSEHEKEMLKKDVEIAELKGMIAGYERAAGITN